jgi:protein TonB
MSSPDSKPSRLSLRTLGTIALIVLLLVGAYYLVKTFSKPAKKGKPTAQQIQLVRPNTPPPPPPKPPEKPPEPPKIKEEVKVETPKEAPKAEAPPPGERLGVDAQGSGSGDGFGLAANPGGRDITQAGAGGPVSLGGVASVRPGQFNAYRDLIVRFVNDELNRVDDLKQGSGQLAVLVWVDRSGRIEKVDLRDATAAQSQLVRSALMNTRGLREPPPESLPQPVWVLINLRELG